MMTNQEKELAEGVFTIAAAKAKAKLHKDVRFAFTSSGDPQISVGGKHVVFHVRNGSVFGPNAAAHELGKLISAEEISDSIAKAILDEIAKRS
jgi:hypothetical protein